MENWNFLGALQEVSPDVWGQWWSECHQLGPTQHIADIDAGVALV